MTDQAFRYKKTIWSADEARTHCKDHGGSFTAATEEETEMRGWVPRPEGRTYFAQITRKYNEQLGTLTRHFIEGYAATDEPVFGIQLSLDATRKAMEEYDQWRNVRFMHEYNPVGVVRAWNVDDKGVFIRAQIMDEPVWQKVEQGLVTAFSIGYGFNLTDEIWEQWLAGETITPKEYWLAEISIVDNPADPECSFSIVRRMDGANVGDATAGEIYHVVHDALADFFKSMFGKRKFAEGGEIVADKERDLAAEVERLSKAYEETERALAAAKAEIAERNGAEAAARTVAAVDYVRGLCEAKVLEPAQADIWIARYLVDPEWVEEHAALLRDRFKEKLKGQVKKEGRPADTVSGLDADSEPIAARARELQKIDPKISWEEAVNIAARELTEGV